MKHIMRYRMFVFLVLMAVAAVSFAAYDGAKPADNEYVADVPALVRENFRAIKDDAIVNAGAVSGYSVGSASGNIPRNDGTLNTNLNSDKLDGKEATDFVASATMTAHEADTSTHGKTTIAGMEDIDDLSGVTDAATARTNLGVVGSSATVLTSGANAMVGNLKFSGNYGILQSTSDGADNGWVLLAGGGSGSTGRGGHIYCSGNENAATGQIQYFAGNVTGGDHIFYTGAGTERFRIMSDGTIDVSGTIALRDVPVFTDAVMYTSGPIEWGVGDGSSYPIKFEIEQDSGTTYLHSNLYYSGGYKCYDTGRAAAGIRMTCLNGDSYITFYTHPTNNTAPSERMRISKNGNTIIGTTTDDGSNKLQVTGNTKLTGNLTVTGVMNIPQSAPSSPANGDIWLQ